MSASDFWQDQYVSELKHHTNQNLTIANDFIKVVQERASFKELLKNTHSLLEIGCGTGDMCEILRTTFSLSKVAGIDLSINAIDFAKTRFSEIDFIQFDILNQDISTLGNFDIIISSNTLEHFYDPYAIIDNFLPFCQYFVVIVPFSQPPDGCGDDGSGGHIATFYDDSFNKFEIVDKFLFRTDGWVYSSKGEVPQQLVLFIKGKL
jgi:ubiquinone/menaquinone biosynthesis C-methylase UbiE